MKLVTDIEPYTYKVMIRFNDQFDFQQRGMLIKNKLISEYNNMSKDVCK